MSSGTGTVDLGQSGVPAEPERSGEPTGGDAHGRGPSTCCAGIGEANVAVVTVCGGRCGARLRGAV